MKKSFEQLPGWEFEIEEVSAGVYRTIGRDRNGRHLSYVGEDPEDLLRRCKAAAMATRAATEAQPKEGE